MLYVTQNISSDDLVKILKHKPELTIKQLLSILGVWKGNLNINENDVESVFLKNPHIFKVSESNPLCWSHISESLIDEKVLKQIIKSVQISKPSEPSEPSEPLEPSEPSEEEGSFSYDSLAELRKKLLDLTARNRLINYQFPAGSSIRLIDELPNQITEVLRDGQEMSFLPVKQPTENELLAKGFLEKDPQTSEIRKLKSLRLMLGPRN